MKQVIVPDLPESVADATIAKWYKSAGDQITAGDKLLDLETDKVMLEIEAEVSGIMAEVLESEGSIVSAGALLANITEGAVVDIPTEQVAVADENAKQQADSIVVAEVDSKGQSPVVRRLLAEHKLDAAKISATGKSGRLTKQDIELYLASVQNSTVAKNNSNSALALGEPRRVPMSRLRAKVAERLNDSQKNAVILTTFNEVDLSAVMNLRKQYKDIFQDKHDIKLGFMSFFVKASVAALAEFPIINASVEGQDILYHDYFDIGVAIAAPRGLVVPVIRGANHLSMAAIEKSIKNYALQAKDNKLSLDDMTGGTFTITNGGTFGSMMSTPIINPPQSAILGMHNIVQRPVVVDGEIVIRPMMYLALSYDHRIIDGSDSVRFLVMIKQLLEDPARLLLAV